MQMQMPRAPKIIPCEQIGKNTQLRGIRFVDYGGSENDRDNYNARLYQFQNEPEAYSELIGILSLKGNVASQEHKRLSFLTTIPLKKFVDTVRYDPSNPPVDDYHALDMIAAHEKTQSDFKGAKAANKELFMQYLMEGLHEERTLYLPVISAWQSITQFPKTIFVAYDSSNPDSMYGRLLIPRGPLMESDGQTQTAALFGIAKNSECVQMKALDNIAVTLEIELGLDAEKAGQSFADRNGRGSKKNINLVISMDVSSPLSKIRTASVAGTVFQDRIATGRSGAGNITETSVDKIMDLSTIEQVLLLALTGDRTVKAQAIKHFHVPALIPFAKEFLKLLSDCFGGKWLNPTPANMDAYRQLYVHGWAFAQKALAIAYFQARKDQLGPIADSLSVKPAANENSSEVFAANIKKLTDGGTYKATLSFDELKDRIEKINWYRHKAHWIAITGKSSAKGGTRTLKSLGTVVKALAQNSPVFIDMVVDKIIGSDWEDLTSDEDAPLQ